MGVRGRVVVVLGVLLGLLTANHADARPAPAVPPPAAAQLVTGVPQNLADYLNQGLTLQQAVTVRHFDDLVASGLPKSAVPLHASLARPRPGLPYCLKLGWVFTLEGETDVQPAGDLNGDKRPDLLENHYAARDKNTYTWVVNARDAMSGRLLWRRTRILQNTSKFSESGFTMAGKAAGGRPGAVEFVWSYRDDSPSPAVFDLALANNQTMLDRHGRPIWRSHQSGSLKFDLTGELTYTHAPLDYRVATLRASGQDMLVTSYHGSSTAGVSGTLTKTGLESGRTALAVPVQQGRAITPALPVVGALTLQTDGAPIFDIVPDQNGDRRPDLSAAELGDAAGITVYAGTTGHAIWSQLLSPLASRLHVVDAGIITSSESRLHDLALVQTGNLQTPDLPLVALDAGDGLVTLASAGTGNIAWIRPGSMAYATGRGTVALGLTRSSYNGTSTTRTIDLIEYDALGAPGRHSTHDITRSTLACGYSVTLLFADEDYDADGVGDPVIYNFMFDVKDVYIDQITMRASDGTEFDRSPAFGLLSAVDGHGVDRGLLSLKGNHLDFDVRTGDHLKRLLTARLPFAGGIAGVDFYALPITSRCADVIAGAFGSKGSTFQFTASNGQPWWTIAYGDKDPYGHLTSGHRAKPRC